MRLRSVLEVDVCRVVAGTGPGRKAAVLSVGELRPRRGRQRPSV